METIWSRMEMFFGYENLEMTVSNRYQFNHYGGFCEDPLNDSIAELSSRMIKI